MLFGDRLKKLREQKGISQRDLAKLIQLSPSTVAMYELNQRSPDKDTIVNLADFFNVTTDYLLGRDERRTIYKLPILGTIRAGLPILAQENIEGYLEVPDHIRANFVLRVVGDSMVGVGILDGDLAVCKESQVAQSGQIVVALHDLATGFSEATLKYYFNGNGSKPVLKAANPQYQDIKLTEGYRIAGIMVALIREHSPSYLVYQHYLALKDYEEWTEVLEKAIGYGITPQQLSVTLDMQRQMIERIMVDKGKRS